MFSGVPFDRVSISNSAPGFFALSGLVLAARKAGFPLDQIRGSILHGPLYTEDCSYAWHFPVELRVRLALDSIEYCSQHMPKFHAYLEDTYFFSECGLGSIEEMALGFIQLRHLVRKLIARGVAVDTFAPRIAMLVNCSMDFFEEIAKMRATRQLCAKMMRRPSWRRKSALDVGCNRQSYLGSFANGTTTRQQYRPWRNPRRFLSC